ncbi:MAG: aldose epimerase family protein [Rikenellaceae bacterium]
MKKTFLFAFVALLLSSCSSQPKKEVVLQDKNGFDELLDNIKIELFTLENKNGMVAEITNFGGRIVALWAPDKRGNMEDVVLGYDKLSRYLGSNQPYLGAIIGRTAGRIREGEYEYNGEKVLLSQNEAYTHLNGGHKGYHYIIWKANQISDSELELSYFSHDGDEDYPGNVTIKALYTLTDNNELKIEYWATTDAATHVSLSHQNFFNLEGAGNGTIEKSKLMINSDSFTPIDDLFIPTGEIRSVKDTPLDFTKSVAIGDRLAAEYEQMEITGGYDHNWVLNTGGDVNVLAARVEAPVSKRTLEVYTNQPGIQFYSGNEIGALKGKYGMSYEQYSAFSLQPQHFPNSANIPEFPSTLLEPGEEYYWVTIYKFGVK